MKIERREPQDHPEYNLTELCQYAGITLPLMKKIQMKLNLGSGEKVGGRTYYTRAQARTYDVIKALRIAGFEFEEIIRLDELEKQIRAFEKSQEYAEMCGTDAPCISFSFILHPGDFIMIPPYKEISVKFQRLLNKHEALQQRVKRKCAETMAIMQRLNDYSKKDVGIER